MYDLFTMAHSKNRMVNVRLSPTVHENFKTACDLRGVSMSSLLHQFIVRTIREEREMEPRAFERKEHVGQPVAPSSQTKMPLKRTKGRLKKLG